MRLILQKIWFCSVESSKREQVLLEAVLLVDAVPDLPRLRSSVACVTLRVQQQVNILGVRRLLVCNGSKNTLQPSAGRGASLPGTLPSTTQKRWASSSCRFQPSRASRVSSLGSNQSRFPPSTQQLKPFPRSRQTHLKEAFTAPR